MSRTTLAAAVLILAALGIGTAPASAGDASTIRVEPRPFYGATITLEAGVRVFRPLPRQKYVVINPDHRTPLNLGLTEINKTSHSYNQNHNYNYDQTGGANSLNGVPYYAGSVGRSGRKSSLHGHGGHQGHGGRGGHGAGGLSR